MSSFTSSHGVDQPQQAAHLFANRILLLQGQDHSGMLSTCIHPISMKRVKVPHVEAVENPAVLNTPPKLPFVRSSDQILVLGPGKGHPSQP